MSGLFGNNIFTIAQKSLDFRTSRHDLLASNVANKDTPGYQAEDLVFRASLEKALQAEQPGPLKQTCLLYTSPSPRDRQKSRMPSSA